MFNIIRFFIGLDLAVLLLLTPSVVGAEVKGGHRIFFSEDDTARNGGVADYAMIQLTDLEIIAGRQHLDRETIQFLEENLWLPEPTAKYANVNGLDHSGLCQGEGLIGHGNRAGFVESFGSISLYCSPRAGGASTEGNQPPPVGDHMGDQMGYY